MVLIRLWILKGCTRARLLRSFNGELSALLLFCFDSFWRSGLLEYLIWLYGRGIALFSPAWDAIELTLKVGFICPFVVICSTELGATLLPRPYVWPSSKAEDLPFYRGKKASAFVSTTNYAVIICKDVFNNEVISCDTEPVAWWSDHAVIRWS